MSLEGLNSLIQLEGARLESSRQTSQNFQQVGSAVQQVGMQTANSKQQLWFSKIEATFNKEVQEAEVKKIEAKLARARKAEGLAKGIALGVAAISGVGNLWNAAQDMLGAQKLGDIPNYMKVKPIDPSSPDTKMFTGKRTNVQDKDGNDTGQSKQAIYAVGSNKDGSETVQSIDRFNNGNTISPKSATISKYDIERVLGDNPEFQKLKADFPSGVKFSDLLKSNMELADTVMKDKCHGMGREEAEGFMKVLEHNCPPEKATTRDYNEPTPTGADAQKKLSQIASITSSVPPIEDKDKLAKVMELVNKSSAEGLTLPKDTSVAKDGIPKETLSKLETASPGITAKIASIVGTDKKETSTPKFEMPTNCSFAVIHKPDGSQEVTMLDKSKGDNKAKAVTLTFDKSELGGKKFEDIFDKKGSEAVEAFINKANSSFTKTDVVENTSKENTLAANVFANKIDQATLVPSAIDSLKTQGLLDKTYDGNIMQKGMALGDKYVKPLVNALVSTAQDTAPYLQAYLKAKDRADNLEDELQAARSKLAAMSKKLNMIQMQIDQFNGRGA